MRILLFGHSLIEFGDWSRLLPGHTVTSLGRAGETTAGLLGRLDDAVRIHPKADAVAVMSGTNDILAGDNDAFLHEYRSVTRRLRRAYPGAAILLHALLPLSPDWVSPEAIAQVNAAIARIGTEIGVTVLDLTDRFTGRGGLPRSELYDADGVHLSAGGYRVWADALAEVLGRKVS